MNRNDYSYRLRTVDAATARKRMSAPMRALIDGLRDGAPVNLDAVRRVPEIRKYTDEEDMIARSFAWAMREGFKHHTLTKSAAKAVADGIMGDALRPDPDAPKELHLFTGLPDSGSRARLGADTASDLGARLVDMNRIRGEAAKLSYKPAAPDRSRGEGAPGRNTAQMDAMSAMCLEDCMIRAMSMHENIVVSGLGTDYDRAAELMELAHGYGYACVLHHCETDPSKSLAGFLEGRLRAGMAIPMAAVTGYYGDLENSAERLSALVLHPCCDRFEAHPDPDRSEANPFVAANKALDAGSAVVGTHLKLCTREREMLAAIKAGTVPASGFRIAAKAGYSDAVPENRGKSVPLRLEDMDEDSRRDHIVMQTELYKRMNEGNPMESIAVRAWKAEYALKGAEKLAKGEDGLKDIDGFSSVFEKDDKRQRLAPRLAYITAARMAWDTHRDDPEMRGLLERTCGIIEKRDASARSAAESASRVPGISFDRALELRSDALIDHIALSDALSYLNSHGMGNTSYDDTAYDLSGAKTGSKATDKAGAEAVRKARAGKLGRAMENPAENPAAAYALQALEARIAEIHADTGEALWRYSQDTPAD